MLGGENYGALTPIFSLLLFLLLPSSTVTEARSLSSPSTSSTVKFTPPDNYLIRCGAPKNTKLDDGRIFLSDPQSLSYLSTNDNIKITSNVNSSSISPLYTSARVFTHTSIYKFFIAKPGHHWIRLHFYPLPDPVHHLTSAKFSVQTDSIVLLNDFSFPANNSSPSPLLKEYLMLVTNDRLSIQFIPSENSIAFINAIEVISAPDGLIHSTATSIFPQMGDFSGISNYSFQVTNRINVGGEQVLPKDDPLAREWQPDSLFLSNPQAAENVTVDQKVVKFPKDGTVTALNAPSLVYSSAVQMGNSEVVQPSFNVTWQIPSDSDYSYLVRMHFCDIVSRSLDSLYFNVYLNSKIAASSLDLSTLTKGLSVAYFQDFVVNSSTIANSTIMVQVGVVPGLDSGVPNAILNGLEVMKMSNEAGSLDGPYAVDGSYHGDFTKKSKKNMIIAGIGIAMGVIAMILLAVVVSRWRNRPANYDRKNSFSSWLLPLNGTSTVLRSESKGNSNHKFGSRRSRSGHKGLYVGRHFSLAQLREATDNFAEQAVIGIGGFGKVYLGELDDGTKLAIKRGNPSSQQGIHEFHTEIEMLSKLRHRHLVSLIGCCDENSEMILVYEYMAKGPLKDHLYGSSTIPPLSWKQRLEACIGAARGLHYLHTGAAEGIIHRDVKTTNILLDENYVAKMADFGLSKTGPSLEQTHVSTAVKGSFGYLDPEYFRSQQLTDKSDVYSFGVVLFEVLCARPALSPTLPRDQVNLAEWAMSWNRKGQVEKIVDTNIVDSVSPASLKKFVEAAEKCVAECGVDRPSMGDVLWNLEYALQLQEASVGEGIDDGVGSSARHIILESTDLDEDEGDHDEHDSSAEMPEPLIHGR